VHTLRNDHRVLDFTKADWAFCIVLSFEIRNEVLCEGIGPSLSGLVTIGEPFDEIIHIDLAILLGRQRSFIVLGQNEIGVQHSSPQSTK